MTAVKPTVENSIALALADGVELKASELGKIADYYHDTKTARLAADKAAAALKTKEEQAKNALITQMRAQGISAAGGKKLRCTIDPEPDYKPTVKDWSKLYAHILKTKDFSFLQKRIGEAAVKERWEDGVIVPGVDKFPMYKLSTSEIK